VGYPAGRVDTTCTPAQADPLAREGPGVTPVTYETVITLVERRGYARWWWEKR
jgi:hypothetical protein